jgi:hypothetical protein
MRRRRLIGVILLIAVAVAALWVTEWRQRISAAAVERSVVRQMNASAAHCSKHSANGSSRACLVGPPPDPDCTVIHVSPSAQ